ncbi:uncharacterized protein LOC126905392 [Daktulosphaira vitifoliae]|uniref:uncharacterized protein LOC126905392 n=1 Tax=Daktulosphaira vitifoliae TaxID=58002 RepID=UPI0021A9DB57|nr:uncharacterized protein LOC126905392 [Daktulosphaira vitifoliae]
MKVVALISGGKDSCYNMMQCIAAGHDIVALANLQPHSRDELDSYMYQSVGHQAIDLYAEAMGLPLFRQQTNGVALQQEKVYTRTPKDEVEDLFDLLVNIKKQINFDAIAVGAILSDYQRLRVEDVCSRLGLCSLSYLWRRDQKELLQEMIDCNIEAIVIKVAALGLDPTKHLGLRIDKLMPHLVQMNEKYGLNICGEGGEYETFTLDCPLFTKSVIIEEFETVMHTNDVIAPVGYINFKKFCLLKKPNVDENQSFRDRLAKYSVRSPLAHLMDLDDLEIDLGTIADSDNLENITTDNSIDQIDGLMNAREIIETDSVSCIGYPTGWTWINSLVGYWEENKPPILVALEKLRDLLCKRNLELSDVVAVTLYVRDMTEFLKMNELYASIMCRVSPPVRVCVEIPLSEHTPILMDVVAYKPPRKNSSNSNLPAVAKQTMHVQSISHWAPANIGPYSQAIKVGDIIYVAGQIALVPGTLNIVEGGILRECRLSLRHVSRIIKAVDSNTQLRDVVQGICYVTNTKYIHAARTEWEKRTNNAIVDYVVVSRLPKDAVVEWHLWAHKHNSRFEYEETGCCVDNYRVSIRRRWNYENNVAAIVTYISSGSCTSLLAINDFTETSSEVISATGLEEAFRYSLKRLLRGEPTSTPTDAICSLRIFYKVSCEQKPPIYRQLINSTLKTLKTEFHIVATVVPVLHLHHPNTFVSIYALRHNT